MGLRKCGPPVHGTSWIQDFGEGLRLNDNVVTDGELDGNGFDKLIYAWVMVGLKEGN